MAASPQWKVYTATGEYRAATKSPDEAVAIIAVCGGEGWTIRYAHSSVVWREGHEAHRAAESYDYAITTCFNRLSALQQRNYDAVHGGR